MSAPVSPSFRHSGSRRVGGETVGSSIASATLQLQPLSTSQGDEEAPLQLWPVWAADTFGVSMSQTASLSSRSSLNSSGTSFFKVEFGTIRGGDTMKDSSCLGRLAIGPNSPIRLWWDIVSVFAVGFDVLTVPLIAFNLDNTFMHILGVATTVFWTMDLIMTFLSGFHVGGVVEMRLRIIAWHYLTHWFLLDFTIICTDWLLLLLQSGFAEIVGIVRISKTLRLGRILRLFRLLRVIKLPSLSEDICGNVQSETLLTVLGVLRSMAIIAVVNHFIACTWYYIGDSTEPPTWTSTLEEEGRAMGYRYVTALHWSLTQFTPASMEIVPRNSSERLFAIIVLFSALVTFSTFVSSITNAMTTLRRINMERSKQRDNIRRYIADNRVSLELANRINAFLRTHNFMAKRRVHEEDIQVFKVLPETLRLQLHWEVYTPNLAPHPFFYHLMENDEQAVLEVCHFCMVEQYLGTSQELFTSGKACKSLYVVVSGFLEYYYGQHDALHEEVEEGSWICEVALWLRWEHRGRLSALMPCEFVSMDSGRFRAVMVKRPQVVSACRQYARMYLDLVTEFGCSHPTEVWWDHSQVQEMAQKAFESTHVEADVDPQHRGAFRRLWRSWSPPDFVNTAVQYMNRRCNTL